MFIFIYLSIYLSIYIVQTTVNN